MGVVITSGTSIREIEDQRADAKAAYQRVMDLVSMRRPNVRVFDQDGHSVGPEQAGADGEPFSRLSSRSSFHIVHDRADQPEETNERQREVD
jgi:hypothetical protein